MKINRPPRWMSMNTYVWVQMASAGVLGLVMAGGLALVSRTVTMDLPVGVSFLFFVGGILGTVALVAAFRVMLSTENNIPRLAAAFASMYAGGHLFGVIGWMAGLLTFLLDLQAHWWQSWVLLGLRRAGWSVGVDAYSLETSIRSVEPEDQWNVLSGLHERLEVFPGQPLLACDLLDVLGRRHTLVLLDHLGDMPEPGGPEGMALRETQENVLIGLGGRMSEQRILG